MHKRKLQVDGGAELVLREYVPAGKARASVVIGGAMGVQQGFYAPFARWLAEQGYRVTTFDYRGHGDSLPDTPGHTLRGFRADLFDWTRDYEAVVCAAKDALPEQPLYLIGHSLGAQLPGLFEQPDRVDGLFSVAAGSGYWRDNAPRLRRGVLYFWHVLVPVATRVCGYFPGRGLRKVGDLPAGVIRQWRRWCLHPRYSVGAEGAAVAERYAQVRFPVLAWSFKDDELMTLRGTRALVGFYPNAPSEVHSLGPEDVLARRIGHFGLFREHFRTSLWPKAVEALQALEVWGGASVTRMTAMEPALAHTTQP